MYTILQWITISDSGFMNKYAMSGIIILDNKRQFYYSFVKIKAKAIFVFCISYNQNPEIHSVFPLQYTLKVYTI